MILRTVKKRAILCAMKMEVSEYFETFQIIKICYAAVENFNELKYNIIYNIYIYIIYHKAFYCAKCKLDKIKNISWM